MCSTTSPRSAQSNLSLLISAIFRSAVMSPQKMLRNCQMERVVLTASASMSIPMQSAATLTSNS
jgi:hypothetical protein